MAVDRLFPSLDLLREEYVLVQAWKKTAAYIRGHNWYADVLDLDRTTVDLPRFLTDLRMQLESPDGWETSPLRIVPAPKSQEWHINNEGRWRPRGKVADAEKAIRPLAHVSLRDQVLATALLLCVADRVETMQNDPRLSVSDFGARRQVLSYGHRLFCDVSRKELRHRWGSSKLYRGFFQDYRRFLKRPESVAEELKRENNRIAIVHADQSKFYDRIRPTLLHSKLEALRRPGDDGRFFDLARRALRWNWHSADAIETARYAHAAEVEGFDEIGLPQGLVASGFFSNIVLLDFDQGLRGRFDESLAPRITLRDACRYVDDLRLVVEVGAGITASEVKGACIDELTKILAQAAPGLQVSDAPKKTTVAFFGEDRRPLVLQSRSMERIQHAVSGGFDAKGGAEILAAIDGLFRMQERFGRKRQGEEIEWPLSPVPDVRDETVARFGAGRYRRTFRSLRVLLDEKRPATDVADEEEGDAEELNSTTLILTREELDAQAEVFSISLIESWIADPANMRLLRIALDLYPDPTALDEILKLLRQYVAAGGGRKAPRRIAWYCLSELFRAGATETGLVHDDEFLPTGSNIKVYRERLREEAATLLNGNFKTLPWYLKQQVLLYLAAVAPEAARITRVGAEEETRHYRQLLLFLTGKRMPALTDDDFFVNAILTRRSFLAKRQAIELAGSRMSPMRLEQILVRDPAFAEELLVADPDLRGRVETWMLDDLGLANVSAKEPALSQSLETLARQPDCLLRDESNLLRFAIHFLRKRHTNAGGALVPRSVQLRINNLPQARTQRERSEVAAIELDATTAQSVLYDVPPWCPPSERWRFELGTLLRFSLTGCSDYFAPVREPSWKQGEPCYRTPRSHWEQRLYGNFNGREAFGPSWLPISTWVEEFLIALLRWPGCRTPSSMNSVGASMESAIRLCEHRLAELEELRGTATGTLHLLHAAEPPQKYLRKKWKRPLRICVAQTVIPDNSDWAVASQRGDLELSAQICRRKHRSHLAAMLAGVEQMLRVRETHRDFGNRLDWLILPELSVHPRDIYPVVIPFVRRHRCIVLAGLTYHRQTPGGPLINSALWLLPEWSRTYGLQIRQLEQGKQHLAPGEADAANGAIVGFRPAQWLVGYRWNSALPDRLLILSASVCYDATDLSLAADLRDCSDIYAICALNRDVATFDTMTQALHYHMYQTVILSNNGAFGGSNAYTPYHLPYHRQVFHAHGQPQATVAFLEIEPADLLARGRTPQSTSGALQPAWKAQPAGWRPRQ